MNFKEFLQKNNYNGDSYSEVIVNTILKYHISEQKVSLSKTDIYNLFVMEDYLRQNLDVTQNEFENMVKEIKSYSKTLSKFPNSCFVDDLRDFGAMSFVCDYSAEKHHNKLEKKFNSKQQKRYAKKTNEERTR